MIANMLAIRQGSIGHIRYILKDSLKYLPFYGAYFRQVSCHQLLMFMIFTEHFVLHLPDHLRSSELSKVFVVEIIFALVPLPVIVAKTGLALFFCLFIVIIYGSALSCFSLVLQLGANCLYSASVS